MRAKKKKPLPEGRSNAGALEPGGKGIGFPAPLQRSTNLDAQPAPEKEAGVINEKISQQPHAQRKTLQQKSANKVTQREDDGKEEESGTISNLDEAIAEFKELLEKAKEKGPGSNELNTLAAYIVELEAVASGSDEEAKTALAAALQEQMQHAPSPGETTTGTENNSGEVMQGRFLIPWLFSFFKSNPIALIPVGLFILERGIAEWKRKKLPPRTDQNLFINNRTQFALVVGRKVLEYCRLNGIGDPDMSAIKTACHLAVYRANSADNFYGGELVKGLFALDYAGPNTATAMGANNHTFMTALETGVIAVSGRTIEETSVPEEEKAGFSEALRGMYFVKRIYSGGLQKSMARTDNERQRKKHMGKWKDGGNLDDNIQEVDDGNKFTRDRREVDNGNFQEKVTRAETFIQLAVEKSRLNYVVRPQIHVHLRGQSKPTRPWGFRAFQRGSEIHVAQDENIDVIVHELGHYIESYLPLEQWNDIQLLLQSRNEGEQKGGYIYPHSYREQRFGGDYPGTGKYTSKYYESGDTEVMSKSLEFLAHPTKFKDLIEKDPQQAAIILRSIRPHDFNSVKALKPYRKYLPQ